MTETPQQRGYDRLKSLAWLEQQKTKIVDVVPILNDREIFQPDSLFNPKEIKRSLWRQLDKMFDEIAEQYGINLNDTVKVYAILEVLQCLSSLDHARITNEGFIEKVKNKLIRWLQKEYTAEETQNFQHLLWTLKRGDPIWLESGKISSALGKIRKMKSPAFVEAVNREEGTITVFSYVTEGPVTFNINQFNPFRPQYYYLRSYNDTQETHSVSHS